MNSHIPKSKKLSLDELVFSALSQLQVLQYNQCSIRRYQTVWRKLVAFARQQDYKGKLREQLILDFLAHHELHSELPTESYSGWKRHAEYGLTLLWRYARFGYFERGKQHIAKRSIPVAMQQSLHNFKKYCEEERYLSHNTVTERLWQVGLFLDFLGKRDVKNFNQIRTEDLSDFVYSLARYRQKTVASMVSDVRVYLRYLFYKGKLKRDLIMDRMVRLGLRKCRYYSWPSIRRLMRRVGRFRLSKAVVCENDTGVFWRRAISNRHPPMNNNENPANEVG